MASAQHVSENSGIKGEHWSSWFDHCVHFTLGPWEGDLAGHVKRVSIQCEQVPEKTETTRNAWLESNVLPVLHGQVTRPDGRPIANAVVQIREERKEGQRGIAAPDVRTDRQGFYCFDAIRWAYHVGVLAYTYKPSGDGYRHEYKHLNRTLHGTNKVDFILEEPSSGTGVIKGRMLAPDGEAVQEFKLDVRNHVDWNNRSGEYLYQFGIKEYVSNPEGKFEMSGLPPGKYQVMLMPTKKGATGRYDDIVNGREYSCELTEGQTIDITREMEADKAWHGRLQFDDGTPAVMSGAVTEIVKWSKGFDEGRTVARVDQEGYFKVPLPDDALQRLKSGQSWLTINIAKSSRLFSKVQKEKFPFALMSMDKEKAGTLKISRPGFHHGRVLYEDGNPAVPPVMPWDGAGVSIRLRCKAATARSGGIREHLGSLDDQGSFSIILTGEQLRKLQAGEYSLEIMHPSYEEDRVSFPISRFPARFLRSSRDAVKGYILPPESMTKEYRNIAQCLDSYEMLETLASLLEQWRAEHNGEFPMSLSALNSYAGAEVFARITENIEYQPDKATGDEAEASLIAYDKRLLEKIKGTHVLFSNGKIEFLRQRKLGTIDIHR
ncbi:MAG: MSCRAMM family protein [Planctomycetota bacterium]